MNKDIKKTIAIFENEPIRRHWDDKKEKWYFSVVDIVRALTESVNPGAYWRKLKQRLREEGNEIVTLCHGLKFIVGEREIKKSNLNDSN